MLEMKCPQCGGEKLQALGNNVYKCMYCGHIITDTTAQQQVPPQPQVAPQPQTIYVQQQQPQPVRIHDRSKIVAALLALFIGGWGIHKFYLGQTVAGVLYILFCWTFIPSIIAFIEFIGYLIMSDAEFDRKYNYV